MEPIQSINVQTEEEILDFDTIINKLEERKSTHPNLSTTWIHYLKFKKQNLEKTISNANKILNMMDTIENDMTHEAIYIMWWLMTTNMTNREIINTI